MWIISLLPNTAIHLILTISILGLIAGFVLGFIPLIGRYKLPIQLISLLLFAFSLYIEGGLSNQAAWEAKVKELEVKLAEADAKSAKVNTVIVTRYITKREVIKEKGDDIIRFIDKEVVKYDKSCPIPEVVIRAHNAAALNKAVDEIVTTTTPIDTKDHNAAASKSTMKLPKK